MDESNVRPLDSVLDLSKGDRDYLRRKGINGSQFDKMTALEQNEWKEECKEGAYEKNDYELGTVVNRTTHFMSKHI